MESFSDLLFSFEKFVVEKVFTKNQFWSRFVPVIAILFFTYLFLGIFNPGYYTILFRKLFEDLVLHHPQEGFFWDLIINQGSHLFDQSQGHFFMDHMASRKFRVVIPFLANVFHLTSFKLFLLQIGAGLLFANLLLKYLTDLFQDKFSAFLALLAFENIYVGGSFFVNVYGHIDGFTYLFLFLTLLFFKRLILLTLFLQLSFWSDERSLFAVIPVFLIHYVRESRDFKKLIPQIIELVLNYLVYFVLYIFIGFKNKIGPFYSPQSANFHNYLDNISHQILWIGGRLFDALESFWIILLLGGYYVVFTSKNWIEKCLFLGYLGAVLGIDLLVADTIRATSFAFILLIYCFYILKEHITFNFIKELLYVVALISILKPFLFP